MKDLILIQWKRGLAYSPSRNASNYIVNDYIIKPGHPISHNDPNPIIFNVENSDSRIWTVPNSIRIHLEAKVTLLDGYPISPTHKLSLQDLLCHLLFQQIETRINNVAISDTILEQYHTVFTLFKLILSKTLLQI